MYVVGLTILSFLVVVFSYRHGSYAFCLFIALAMVYELSGLAIRAWTESLVFLIPSMRLYTYGSGITEVTLQLHLLHVAIFLLLATASYYVAVPIFSARIRPPTKFRSVQSYWPLLSLLLLFGVLSVLTGAGLARRADYELGSAGYGSTVTGIHSVIFHGRSLLVVAAPLLLLSFRQKRWWLFGCISILALPIVEQLFVAGRRQAFVPFVLFLILYFLYTPTIKRKLLFLVPLTMAFIVATGAMFAARADYYKEAYALAGATQFYRPVFQELMAVSTISSATIVELENKALTLTYGGHLVRAFLDSAIPFFKLGDYLRASIGLFAKSDLELDQIAPYGALSMLADSFLSFGHLGSVILGISAGLLFGWVNPRLQQAYSNLAALNFYDVWLACLVATILVNYRSGIGDAFALGIKFTILYWVPIAVASIFRYRANR